MYSNIMYLLIMAVIVWGYNALKKSVSGDNQNKPSKQQRSPHGEAPPMPPSYSAHQQVQAGQPPGQAPPQPQGYATPPQQVQAGQAFSPHGAAPPIAQPPQSGKPASGTWQAQTKDPWDLPPEKAPWE